MLAPLVSVWSPGSSLAFALPESGIITDVSCGVDGCVACVSANDSSCLAAAATASVIVGAAVTVSVSSPAAVSMSMVSLLMWPGPACSCLVGCSHVLYVPAFASRVCCCVGVCICVSAGSAC